MDAHFILDIKYIYFLQMLLGIGGEEKQKEQQHEALTTTTTSFQLSDYKQVTKKCTVCHRLATRVANRRQDGLDESCRSKCPQNLIDYLFTFYTVHCR